MPEVPMFEIIWNALATPEGTIAFLVGAGGREMVKYMRQMLRSMRKALPSD